MSENSKHNFKLLQRDKPETSATLIMRLLKGYLGGHIKGFVIASVFMAVSAATSGFLAKMMEPVVNQISSANDGWNIIEICVAIMAAFTMRGIATYFHTVLMNKIGQRIVTDVQQDMYRHILKADLAFYHANASGNLISRMTNDVAVMRQAVGECMTSSVKSGLTLLGLVSVMFYQDWRLATASFVVFPATAWFVGRVGKKMRRLSTNSQIETGNFASCLNQTFQGARYVKAYGMEAQEMGRIKSITENIYKLAIKGFKASALTNPVAEVLSGIAIVTVILYGGWQVSQGQNTPGALFSFITAFLLAYDPMKRMAKVNAQLQAGLAAAERVFQLLDTTPEIVDKVDAVPLVTENYDVHIDDVVFKYPDGTIALDHLNVTVPHGKTVALVGASGAGKSTIINLIPRFYDVVSGHITIGGIDVRDVTMKSLRSQLALVSQETLLFDDTVRANIAYGKDGASQEEIEEAAKAASADGFIRLLPEGYDTIVGEHGVKLSGGQRQRIAIARAMLRNAPILLLDEATSALDNESERAVQAALKRLQEGRTTIVVAHRLSTIVDSDQIVVLDRGKVVEQGTHAELLSNKGVYAKLYGMQSYE